MDKLKNLMPFMIAWAVLFVALVVLIVYRRVLARREDETVHLADQETPLISQQVAMAKRLDVVDHWGKILTAVTVVAALAILGGFVYLEVTTPTHY